MVQFLSIIFFSWISSIFVGFFKSSRFYVSLCISKYCFNFELSVNPQCVQQKGFSPVWVRKCLLRSPRCMYHLPHIVHTFGFSPVYESPCFFSSLLVTYLFPQTWHRWRFSPVSITLRTLRLPSRLQPMPHTAHTYRLLSPLQRSEPGLSHTVPDTVCAWSLLTQGSTLFPLSEDW